MLLNPLTKKIITARDVIFYEERTWDWSGQQLSPFISNEENDEELEECLQQQSSAVSIPEYSTNIAPNAAEIPKTAVESPTAAETNPRRVQKRPLWMTDYEVSGIDQTEDPVTHFAFFAYCDPIIYQLDVKSTFLHDELQEEVYIDQPFGYVKQGSKSQLGDNGKILVVCLYVDDLIYNGNDSAMIADFKKNMLNESDMSDLGLMGFFLGIEVMQLPVGIFISQKRYALEILDRFKMKDCNPVSTPTEFGIKLMKNDGGRKINATLYKQIVGSLMYLTSIRPDIMRGVSLISRYMENPINNHLLAAKRIFRYLKGTTNHGILYKSGAKENLFSFSNSDYAGDIDDRKSTSGSVFMMSCGAVSWSLRKQQIVTLSSTEAEFVAAASCSCQAIWLRRFLETLQNQ
eukprot:XP_015578840.1 uncharacterized protein LOC107261772 [Ricinus communis]